MVFENERPGFRKVKLILIFYLQINLYRCEKKNHIEKKRSLKLILSLFYMRKKFIYTMD